MAYVIPADLARSTLASGIDNDDTSLTVATGEGSKFSSPTDGDLGILALQNDPTDIASPIELVTFSARSGDVLSGLVRGQFGTSAASHSTDASVSEPMTSELINQIASGASLTISGTVSAATASSTAGSSGEVSDGAHAHGHDSHDNLSGVSADDHHDKSHVHSADGSGTVSHANLSNLTSGDPHTQYITKALVDAKGDLIAATADNTPARVAVGSDGTFLKADSGASAGVSWATPPTQSHNHTSSGGDGGVLTNDEHDGYSELADISAPSSPASGKVRVYSRAGLPRAKLSDGTEIDLSQAGGTGATQLSDLTDVDIPSPADGDVLTFNNGTGKWESAAPTGGGGSAPDMIHLQEQQTAGTSAGTATSGSFFDRIINTEVSDAGNHCTLNGGTGEFTLDAGTYEIDAVVPASFCNAFVAKLRNTSDSTDTLIGTAQSADQGTNGVNNMHSFIRGRFTIAGTKNFKIQQQVTTTRSTSGRGFAANLGVTEVYTDVILHKVA